ncbi:hypothetical protein CEV33_2956 [Brucella grignonensis]|uniref:Uncharacterized protein n=1 Tax=Brucella grignonensis TaxID=94627 RepID=A0A256F306_9HYPH|nr:hypothetical protein CEV33_2956 [Brucella grignonensis]
MGLRHSSQAFQVLIARYLSRALCEGIPARLYDASVIDLSF